MLDINEKVFYLNPTFPNMKIEILQTSQHTLFSRGQYYWHVRSDQGKIISDSGKPFRSKDHCLEMARKVKEQMPHAPIVDLTRG